MKEVLTEQEIQQFIQQGFVSIEMHFQENWRINVEGVAYALRVF